MVEKSMIKLKQSLGASCAIEPMQPWLRSGCWRWQHGGRSRQAVRSSFWLSDRCQCHSRYRAGCSRWLGGHLKTFPLLFTNLHRLFSGSLFRTYTRQTKTPLCAA